MILHVRTRTGGGGPDEAPGGCHVRAQRAGLERRITDEVGEGLGSRQSNRLFTFIGDGHGGVILQVCSYAGQVAQHGDADSCVGGPLGQSLTA